MACAAKVPSVSALLLLLWGLSGCATTTVVRPGEPFHIPGKAVAVTRDGRNLEVTSALRVGDCLRYGRDTSNGEDAPERGSALPMSEVKEIVVLDRGRAALKGLVLGPLIGASAGFLLGLTPAGNCDPGTAGACIFGGPGGMAALLGMAGLIYGPIHGALKDRNQVYVFSPSAGAGGACPEAD